MLEIVQHNNEKKGDFEAIYDEKHAGLMTYVWAGTDKFIIDHTEVEDGFNGKGIGKELVLSAVNYARVNHLKIMPLCPFAKATFDKNKDLQDVLF